MITQVSPAHFAAWRDQASTQPVVLDVREPWELQTASVTPDGFTLLHVPMQSIPARIEEFKSSYGSDQPLACLCHHGIRSQQVANYLASQGFTEVVNLQGGIAAWAQQLDASIAQY
ncbi:MAG: rhodanese-like domain-containing protein [Polaromonas sp.]